MNLAAVKKVLREVHSEPGASGTLSWGRCASSLSLISGIIWVSHILIHTHGLPALDGITAFGLAPYASNKVAAATQSFSNPKKDGV
jgi:hypothetical protein